MVGWSGRYDLHSTKFAFATAPGYFVWNIDVFSPTLISTAADPLLGFLTSPWMPADPSSGIGSDNLNGGPLKVTVSPVSVPEPELAGLMPLELAGLALTHRQRRPAARKRGSLRLAALGPQRTL